MSRIAITIVACVVFDFVIAAEPEVRSFEFDYKFAISGHAAGDQVRIWVPIPKPKSEYQYCELLSVDMPGAGEETIEPKYKNRILYQSVDAKASNPINASVRLRIRRHEVQALSNPGKPPDLAAETEQLFLAANQNVPVSGIPLTWDISGQNQVATARSIYDRVDEHVRYDKSKPGYGTGNTLWVCNSRFGNCTDFHSLFISMMRASKIPARFEIGFPIPKDPPSGKVGGYHCWASFYSDVYAWVPVDISEADKHPEMKEYYFGNLTPDRVHFTTGRDIDLVPKQSGPSLNFFVYPYVEINDKPAKKDQIQLNFAYRDVDMNEQK